MIGRGAVKMQGRGVVKWGVGAVTVTAVTVQWSDAALSSKPFDQLSVGRCSSGVAKQNERLSGGMVERWSSGAVERLKGGAAKRPRVT